MPSSTIPGKVLLWDITELKQFTVLHERQLTTKDPQIKVLIQHTKKRENVVEPFVNATGNADDGRRAQFAQTSSSPASGKSSSKSGHLNSQGQSHEYFEVLANQLCILNATTKTRMILCSKFICTKPILFTKTLVEQELIFSYLSYSRGNLDVIRDHAVVKSKSQFKS